MNKFDLKKHFKIILFSLLVCFIFNISMTIIEQKSINDTLNYIFCQTPNFLKSYILIFLVYCLILSLGKVWIPTSILGIFCFIFALLNYFKIQYRQEPLLPWDIYSISEASSILPSLNLKISLINIVILILIILTIKISFKFPNIYIEIKRKFLGFATIFLISLTSLSIYINCIYINANEWPDTWFRIEYYKQNGLLNSFIYNFRYLSIDKPEEYSQSTINNILDELEKMEIYNTNVNINETPNIIIIMSESLWDAQTLNGIKFDRELLPTINNLRNSAISGYCLSPKFGGGTSNVEFEALTGFSNDYLPDGCIPYQQYIRQNFSSIISFLKSKGYDTLAIHSDEEKNWNRKTAYSHLGFDDFISSEDFIEPEITRGRISDMSVTKRIIEEYEKHKKESKKPWFNFTVTMQNHTGYSGKNFTEKEKVKFSSEYELSQDVIGQLEDYATGINLSDKALQYIIDYFKNIEENTIIIVFGDHRVNLGTSQNQVYKETKTITDNMTEAQKNYILHTTPIIAWSNYKDININLGTLAPYQILPEIFTYYGLEKPKYFMFLDKIREISKGTHLGIILDEKGNFTEKMTEEQNLLYNYFNILEYDYILGKGYSKERLFIYTPITEVIGD